MPEWLVMTAQTVLAGTVIAFIGGAVAWMRRVDVFLSRMELHFTSDEKWKSDSRHEFNQLWDEFNGLANRVTKIETQQSDIIKGRM